MLSFLLAQLWLKKECFQLSLEETNTEAGLLELLFTMKNRWTQIQFSWVFLVWSGRSQPRTSDILAILFPYLCSVKAWALGITHFSAHDWVLLAVHSIMHWHGISGASGRHDFHGMKAVFFSGISFIVYGKNYSLSTLYQSRKLIPVLIHILCELSPRPSSATGSFLTRIRGCVRFVWLQFTIVPAECDPQ